MIKCEVLQNCVMPVAKGSIVYVTEKQFELSRKKLKPLNENKKSEVKVEEVEVKEIETPELPKEKKAKKK